MHGMVQYILTFTTFLCLRFTASSSWLTSAYYGASLVDVGNFWELMANVTAKNRLNCVFECEIREGCNALFYKSTTVECVLLKPQTKWSTPFEVPAGLTITRNIAPVVANPMVYRASSGRGAEVYQPFIVDSYISPTTESVVDLSKKINYTYKHPSMKHWGQMSIEEVHFTLFTGGMEVVKLTFDGRGSSKTDWFSHNRLIASSYPDLMIVTPFVMSIDGYSRNRLFYVVKAHNGCPGDVGWICFKENDWNCAWENQPPYPAFIYSKAGSATLYTDVNGVGLADEFVLDFIVEF